MRLVWLTVVAGCGGSAPPPAASAPRPVALNPAPPIDPHARIVARVHADAALQELAPLDYERPFKAKPWDRGATAKLFGDACQLGDKHACIIAAQLVPLDESGESYRVVEANCLAGDLMSCRALPLDDHAPRFRKAPGEMSRRVECQYPHVRAPCDPQALRAECIAGFPAACADIGFVVPPVPDADELQDRWPILSMDGCRAGIASECENVDSFRSDSIRFEMSQRLCELRPDDCAGLGFVYKSRNDPTHARDSFERECQYGGAHQSASCAQLAGAYLDGTLEEPVPGRAQALLDWACPQLAATMHSYLLRLQPACSHASHAATK
jgi:hypothetical protein